jgi:hypothetical protein
LGREANAARKLDGAMSVDGRTVYFIAKGGESARREECVGSGTNSSITVPSEELWARYDGELPSAYSLRISAPAQTGCGEAVCEEHAGTPFAREAEFEGASTDSSRAFFISAQQLTDGASQDEGENLYESVCEGCEEATEPEALAKRRLIDVSEGAAGHGGPHVLGVMAVSGDGSHVYFVAEGALTSQPNAQGELPQGGSDNLYGYGEGHLRFIATLSPADENEWERYVGATVANVTPDGRHLVFVSHRPLTVDDTRSESEPEAAQVFEYDDQTGALTRISVGEDGYDDDGNAGTGNASIVAGSIEELSFSVPQRSGPTMSDDGAYVFFMSPVALAPGALDDVVVGPEVNSNGRPTGGFVYAKNIYEYHDGHVSLLSDGKDLADRSSQNESEDQKLESSTNLFGTDASGSNVFFSTFDALVPGDTDTDRDYYDAAANRCVDGEGEGTLAAGPDPVCGGGESLDLGGFPAPALAAPCEGEACHPGGGGSSEGSPASERFTGPGNLAGGRELNPAIVPKPVTKKTVTCKKGFVKNKKGQCVKKPKKRSKAKKASRNRRGK